MNLYTTILLKKVQCPLLTSVCMLQVVYPGKFFIAVWRCQWQVSTALWCTSLSCVSAMKHLFNSLLSSKACIGNSDEQFFNLISLRDGVFHDCMGMLILHAFNYYLTCSEVLCRHGEVSVHIKGSEIFFWVRRSVRIHWRSFLETKGNAEVWTISWKSITVASLTGQSPPLSTAFSQSTLLLASSSSSHMSIIHNRRASLNGCFDDSAYISCRIS